MLPRHDMLSARSQLAGRLSALRRVRSAQNSAIPGGATDMPAGVDLVARGWHADPSVVGALALLLAVCWACTRRLDPPLLLLAILTVLALESPIDLLSDRYLFSVHMLQHLILILAIAPLLVVALPPGLVAEVGRRLPNAPARFLSHPAIALGIASFTLLVWHLPSLYDAALRSEALHAFEHATFVATSYLFWWNALGQGRVWRASILPRMAYLFLAGLPCALLGAILTFAARPLYASYVRDFPELGLGQIIRLQWGLSALTDQQLGGLLMWIGGGLCYVSWPAS